MEHLPGYADELQAVIDRFVDLYAIIRRNYYHPKFYGSFSLKYVLPALVPEMSYENIAIREGMQASLEYLRMIDPETPRDEKTRIKNDEIELLKFGYDWLKFALFGEKLMTVKTDILEAKKKELEAKKKKS